MSNSFAARQGQFLATVLFLQFAIYVAVFLNIPVARQVLGFIYLTFVPGFILIKLLKLNKLGLLETILFSVGLSIVFLLLIGLFINSLLPLFNIIDPLSTVYVTTIISSVVSVAAVVVFLRNPSDKIIETRFSRSYFLVALLICIPILSVVGAIFTNLYQDNVFILIGILLISLVFAVCVLFKQSSLSQLYPCIIFIFAISLLFQFSFISDKVVGADSAAELLTISNTQTNLFWDSASVQLNSEIYGRLNSMLSITIFPILYSSVLNINSTWIYKIIYPLIFSLVPLVLYQIWQMYISKKYAFVASFLFIAGQTFYVEMLGLARQMLAELFFALLLLIILKRGIRKPDRVFCFVLFSFGLVVSHYALAEIFLLLISSILVLSLVFSRFFKRLEIRNISISMVLIFFTIMFSWYLYTSSSSVFDSFITFGQSVYQQLGSFLSLESRGGIILTGLGLTTPPTIWNAIGRAFAYLTEVLIVIGFVGLITKRLRINYDRMYTLLTSIFIGILGALILVPGLAGTLNMSRFYHILLFLLAPLCALGAGFFVQLIYKRKAEIVSLFLLVTVLTAYFLFQTGFVYEITKTEHTSLPLLGTNIGADLWSWSRRSTEPEVAGVQWLSQYKSAKSQPIYNGYPYTLTAYGSFSIVGRMLPFKNTTQPKTGDLLYLGVLNTRFDEIDVGNTSVILGPMLPFSNKIYSSGECEIYEFSSDT